MGPDSADLIPFQWDADGETRDAEPNDGDGTAIQNDADALRELSRPDRTGDVGGGNDLRSAVHRIGSPFPFRLQLPCGNGTGSAAGKHARESDGQPGNCTICTISDFRGRNSAVQHCMGSMAQCRGVGGDALREAGAISALLGILWRFIRPLRVYNGSNASEDSMALLQALSSGTPAEQGDDFAKSYLRCPCANHLHLQNNNSNFDAIVLNELHTTTLDLAISCLGSLRDLSCGSASNRAAVLAWTPPSPDKHAALCIENGVQLLSAYVKRYHEWKWEDILSLNQGSYTNTTTAELNSTSYTERGKKELRLLTNALGAIRNTSHSTPDVSQECFDHGLVEPLIWRVMPDPEPLNARPPSPSALPSSLPESSRPWREACFRAAGSLINLAEKCPDAAHQLGSNRRLVHLLMETWGGASAIALDASGMNASKIRGLPSLHIGLAAILNAAGSGALEGGLDDVMARVLERENTRKRGAQRREEERKLQQLKQR